MNKKAIGSVFVALALVFALLKSYIWVMVGLLIAAIVFACEEKQTKRIAQCLALVLSVLVVMQLLTLIFSRFGSATPMYYNGESVYYTGNSSYAKFYSGLIKWAGIFTDFYLIVFVVLGAVSFWRDKDMPLYGALIDAIYNGCGKITGKGKSSQGGTNGQADSPRSENQEQS